LVKSNSTNNEQKQKDQLLFHENSINYFE